MYITVQFKDRNKVFKGKTYDYLLNKEEKPPQRGDIIRMLDDNYNYRFYGTRVKVVDVFNDEKKLNVPKENVASIRYVQSSMEE